MDYSNEFAGSLLKLSLENKDRLKFFEKLNDNFNVYSAEYAEYVYADVNDLGISENVANAFLKLLIKSVRDRPDYELINDFYESRLSNILKPFNLQEIVHLCLEYDFNYLKTYSKREYIDIGTLVKKFPSNYLFILEQLLNLKEVKNLDYLVEFSLFFNVFYPDIIQVCQSKGIDVPKIVLDNFSRPYFIHKTHRGINISIEKTVFLVDFFWKHSSVSKLVKETYDRDLCKKLTFSKTFLEFGISQTVPLFFKDEILAYF